MDSGIYRPASRGELAGDVAGTLHSTLFIHKYFIIRYIQNVDCVPALHSPYIFPT